MKPNSSEIEKRVINCIWRVMGTSEKEDITIHTNPMTDLGADSLDVVEIAMSIEEEFENDIPDAEVEKWKTIHDICAYISKEFYDREFMSDEIDHEEFLMTENDRLRKENNQLRKEIRSTENVTKFSDLLKEYIDLREANYTATHSSNIGSFIKSEYNARAKRMQELLSEMDEILESDDSSSYEEGFEEGMKVDSSGLEARFLKLKIAARNVTECMASQVPTYLEELEDVLQDIQQKDMKTGWND